jgi:hypothetical protein
VLILSRQYLKGKCDYYELRHKTDGASRIAAMLFEEAKDITFFVGKAANPAHQDTNLPLGFSIKMRLVKELIANLGRMGKRVKAGYF